MPDAPLTLFERSQWRAALATARLPARLQRLLSGRPAIVIDGQTLDPHLQLILMLRRILSPHGLLEPDTATARARFRRDMLVFKGPETVLQHEVKPYEIRRKGRPPMRALHYAPDADARDLLVFLHGGGFVVGDLDTHDEPCRLLCRYAATHVLSVEYRRSPEHKFPIPLDDALDALRWAQANAASLLDADASRVSLGGDSAGGNLTAAAAQITSREGGAPFAQLLIYPATDIVTPRPSQEMFDKGFFLSLADREAAFQNYTDGTGTPRDDERVSPLLAKDFAGLPPALVVTAGFDVLRDEGKAYADALLDANVLVRKLPCPSLTHGFINMTGVSPAARRDTIRIAHEWRALLDETKG